MFIGICFCFLLKVKVWELPVSSVVIFLAQLRVTGLGDFTVCVSVFNQFAFHTESFYDDGENTT